MNTFFQRNRKLVLHLAFWLVYASFFLYMIAFTGKGAINWARIVPDFTFHIVMIVAMSYLNYKVFIPRLLWGGTVGGYLLRFLPVAAAWSYLLLLGKQWIIDDFSGEQGWVYSARFAVNVIFSALLVVGFAGLLRFAEEYFEREARQKAALAEQLDSELRFLRAQINPHFIFNTLNNLYYLAVSGSQKTPDVIAKLSELMRYLLEGGSQARVPLRHEVTALESYLELEKLRLEEDVPIDFQAKGINEVDPSVCIEPLLLITFLENAFKHGSGGENAFIKIMLTFLPASRSLTFNIANGKTPDNAKAVPQSSGIGLTNVRRRLELGYPERHELTVRNENDRYEVDLQLQL